MEINKRSPGNSLEVKLMTAEVTSLLENGSGGV